MKDKEKRENQGGAQESANSASRRFTLPGILVAVIIAVVHMGFLAVVLRSQLLPGKLLFPIVAAVVVLLILEIFLVASHKKKGRFWTGFVLSLLMTAVLAMGGLYLQRGVAALNNITTGEQVDHVDIYVRKENPAQSVEDLAGYAFGSVHKGDDEHIDATFQYLTDTLGQDIQNENYQKPVDMVDALLEGEVDAIVTREGYLEVLEELPGYAGLREQLRSVYQMEFRDQTEEPADKPSTKSDAFSVYISGIDTYGDVTARSRSDVNILATINPKTHQILLVSTPRDYFVPLSISDGIPDKLTHAGIYGVDVSKDTVGMIYDMDVDYFFRVNFSGFKDIIDSLGGITVYSDYEFAVDGYYYTQGENYLDGASALRFARERHSFNEGDRQRGRNQMAVIQGVINKAMSPEILKNYNSLLQSIEGNFQTSVPYDLVASLVRDQLNNGGSWNVVTYSVDGTGGNEIPYSMGQYAYVMYPDESTVATAKDLIQQVYDGKEVTAP